jgi:hypothetical protein
MGFMDKAKKMAEQAQSKIDDVQKQFNESQGSKAPPSEPVVEYDNHGRPIRTEESQAPPAPPEPEPPGATPPHGDPVAEQPAAPEAATPPAAPTPDPAAPDPNRTDYTPPKLSSGDPLAG